MRQVHLWSGPAHLPCLNSPYRLHTQVRSNKAGLLVAVQTCHILLFLQSTLYVHLWPRIPSSGPFSKTFCSSLSSKAPSSEDTTVLRFPCFSISLARHLDRACPPTLSCQSVFQGLCKLLNNGEASSKH